MKTAEEWTYESGYDEEQDLETWTAEVAHRKAIQLDAIRDAAEIGYKTVNEARGSGETDLRSIREWVKGAILAAADAKTVNEC